MEKNILLSVLLVGLFGVIGCANNPDESKDSNSYFYYEVVNNTREQISSHINHIDNAHSPIVPYNDSTHYEYYKYVIYL